jgi:hypothetical protein
MERGTPGGNWKPRTGGGGEPESGRAGSVLAGYKLRTDATARRLTLQLAAVLWRFVSSHEACLARTAGATGRFDLVHDGSLGRRDSR